MDKPTRVQFAYGGLIHYEQHAFGKDALASIQRIIEATFSHPKRVQITQLTYEPLADVVGE